MPRKLLDRKKAQEATERLAHLASLDPTESEEISLGQFIELSFDELQRLRAQGRTKRGVYNFLTQRCELDLGSYNNFSYQWSKCLKKRISRQSIGDKHPTTQQ